MKKIDIKGKPYVMAHERIKYFRDNYKGAILTDLVSDTDGKCIFKAEIIVDGECVATGYAYEREDASFINKTSYIENCETSAVGRALGMLGIGIDESVASYEEVANAVNNQANTIVDTDIIHFGKHKGKRWSDMDESFLDWVVMNFDKPEIVQLAQDEQIRRQNESASIESEG